ncbi:MAG: hypothetical protein HKP14_02015, partial [Bacteroidia bacterium]|nr:hypothetical protein [Bacteroidia bacterium]
MFNKILPLLIFFCITHFVQGETSAVEIEKKISDGNTTYALPNQAQNLSLTASENVKVIKTATGFRLEVDGKPFFINGMNWDYFPVGTNFNYSLWKQPDALVKAALDAEMSLLKNMGVNTIRMYTGVPAKWITYIYQNYGIYTMLNHSFGRYGLTLDGNWFPNTDYANPKVRKLLLEESTQMVKEYQNTPGILLFLLGNENNYGLFWRGAETEDIPVKDRQSTKDAQSLY